MDQANDILSSILDFLESLTEMFESADGAFASLSEILVGIVLVFEAIFSFLSVLGSIVLVVVSIVTAIVTFIVMLITYILKGSSHYKVAKNAGCKQAWFVWIPFFQDLLCIFVLSRISGKEEFKLGKLKTQEKNLVTLAYALVYFFGSAIVTIIIAACNVVPAVGQAIGAVATLLYLLPAAAMGVIEFVYLRDAINVFKPDEKSNRTHALIITILDSLITFGWARVLYLFTMRKMHPLPVIETEPVVTYALPDATEQTNNFQ